ncbi:MAG: PAS domain S-box protein, partial [Desulfobulbaceae bacterium]|nr:PAS domain S-box protein [Desulfobulbaceae bacterium]
AFGVVRRDPSDKAISIFGTAQDITERKKAEEKIQQSEQFIRNILDTVDEAFITIDRDYRIQTVNKAYCNQIGGCADGMIGQHCYEVSHKTSRPCFEEGVECAARQVFETGEPHSALHHHHDADGNILYVETKAFPVKDPLSDTVTSVIETINNITEKYLLEQERLKTQKLESIGKLAGGIAHDFNNLLQGIFGYISLAKMMLDDKGKSMAALEQAEKALHQSVNLTTQLLTFAKGGKPIRKRINLGPVIENAAHFALSGSRSRCHIFVDVAFWDTEADEGQITQVLQNIVLNADQAMPEGGLVEITAKNIDTTDKTLPPSLAKGNYVAITIKDNGIGISKRYVAKIFDPYFTTKEKGSGLGLATAYSIIKNHNGMIAVKSEPGEGSTFTIYLPALAGSVKIDAVTPAEELTAGATGRILLMDDDPMIRDIGSKLITALGHEVDLAEHGEEALDKYKAAQQQGKPYDLVILDLTIKGGMGGLETIQQLLKIDPHVKAVVSSGYSDDATISNNEKQGFKASLGKPYNLNELREMLNRLLS